MSVAYLNFILKTILGGIFIRYFVPAYVRSQLYCCFYEKKYQSNDWELSDKWNPDTEDDNRYTREKMIPIIGKETINLQLLHEAVDEIINIIKDRKVDL